MTDPVANAGSYAIVAGAVVIMLVSIGTLLGHRLPHRVAGFFVKERSLTDPVRRSIDRQRSTGGLLASFGWLLFILSGPWTTPPNTGATHRALEYFSVALVLAGAWFQLRAALSSRRLRRQIH